MSRAEFDHAVTPPIALEEALKFRPESRTARWRPGVHSSYSNLGAGLAGRVIEVVSGSTYETFTKANVLQRLGLPSANFFPSADQRSRMATGYDRDGRTVIPYWHMIYRPFGGLNIEVPDMGRWLRLLINHGRLDDRQLLPSATVARLEAPKSTAAARAGLRYGYGLGIYAHIGNGHVVYGHGGDADGFLAHFAYSRETRRGYFVVITAFNGEALRAARKPLERAITPASPPTRSAAAPSQDHDRWAGRYESVTWRFGDGPRGSLQVEADDHAIVVHRNGRKRRYVAVGPGRYRGRTEPVATLAFATERGEVLMQGRAGNFRRVKGGSIAHDAPVDEESGEN